MDFGLTEEQRQIQDEIARFAENEIKPVATEYGIRKRNPTSKIVFGSTAQDVLLHSNIPMAVVPLETV
ncbi:hypothetical protein C9J85_05630 [Haloferax sp. wsp5]|nr:hypothetical protein C9J85_05630 [Haloferax sp. wsp5]